MLSSLKSESPCACLTGQVRHPVQAPSSGDTTSNDEFRKSMGSRRNSTLAQHPSAPLFRHRSLVEAASASELCDHAWPSSTPFDGVCRSESNICAQPRWLGALCGSTFCRAPTCTGSGEMPEPTPPQPPPPSMRVKTAPRIKVGFA